MTPARVDVTGQRTCILRVPASRKATFVAQRNCICIAARTDQTNGTCVHLSACITHVADLDRRSPGLWEHRKQGQKGHAGMRPESGQTPMRAGNVVPCRLIVPNRLDSYPVSWFRGPETKLGEADGLFRLCRDNSPDRHIYRRSKNMLICSNTRRCPNSSNASVLTPGSPASNRGTRTPSW